MDFGLLYELQVPRPWGRRSEYDAYWNAVREVVEAERQGFTHVWAVEHHFLEEFSHSAAPEVWLGSVAQHTERIRIGHGVIPLSFNNPVRVAERVAVLDIMSNGRADLGLGRSITDEELGGFHVDPGDTRPLLLEGIELIRKIWTSDGEPINFEGTYTQLHDRSVVPRPLQEPHPPLWVAATSPASFSLAGELGAGVIGFGMATDPPAMARRLGEYRDAVSKSDVIGAVNTQAAVFLMAFCAKTDAEARKIAEDSFMAYTDQSLKYFAHWGKKGATPPPGYEWYAQAAEKTDKLAQRLKFDYLFENDMILCGSPDTINRIVAEFRDAGTDQLILGTSLGTIPHEDVLSSLRLMGEAVLPNFT
jgi:alkanesulfonate monooxygenase SsuD/methylene tetrahydromethanopterin reductase-like flavin-dependent oxidoreductase (luciferase family)